MACSRSWAAWQFTHRRTPGTAWLEYNSLSKTVLIHVLDLIDEAEWQVLIKTRYEALLMEIFE